MIVQHAGVNREFRRWRGGAVRAYDRQVSDDRRVIGVLRDRDEDALRQVVEANTPKLYRAARGMGHSNEEADDLVQEVFLTFMTSLDRFEGRSAVSTWLYGILLRKIQERRRQATRERAHDPSDEAWEANFKADGMWLRKPVDAESALTSRQMGEAIRRCMDGLPAPAREVFVLRQIEALSAEEVRNILDLTITHIGVLLHRARLRMRACLDGKGWRTT